MLITNTIDDALTEIGVKNPEEEAAPKEHEFGLRTLNRIVDSYNTQNLLITYLADIVYQMPTVNNECETADPSDLIARKWNNTVTIGHCKEINSESPVDIEGLFWRQADADYHSKPMTHNQWSNIGYKIADGTPSRHYIQQTDDNNIKIYFDATPTDDLEFHIIAKLPYTGKNSTGNDFLPTDDVNWNFGFEKMLMLRLAIELCSSYSIEPSQSLVARATEAEDNVKTKNYQPQTLGIDKGLPSRARR